MVRVDPNSVTIAGGKVYHCITTADFLTELAGGNSWPVVISFIMLQL